MENTLLGSLFKLHQKINPKWLLFLIINITKLNIMAHVGNLQFTMIFNVSAENVGEGDRIFKSHAAWLAETHHRTGEKALLVYDLSKAPEMKDPMDPNSGTTGKTLFIISEVYAGPEGLNDHWKQAGENWKDFDALKAWMGKGSFTLVNGAPIVHSLW